MSDQYKVGSVTIMEVNQDIIESARQAVQGGQIQGEVTIEIPDYPGMFVAISGNEVVQAISFFVEEEVHYVVGPKRT